MYHGYRSSLITAQNFEYDRFPPVERGRGTIDPVPDMDPPLWAEEEGPPT
jgi:hypothetical protein